METRTARWRFWSYGGGFRTASAISRKNKHAREHPATGKVATMDLRYQNPFGHSNLISIELLKSIRFYSTFFVCMVVTTQCSPLLSTPAKMLSRYLANPRYFKYSVGPAASQTCLSFSVTVHTSPSMAAEFAPAPLSSPLCCRGIMHIQSLTKMTL